MSSSTAGGTGVQLLQLAVAALLAEDPAGLPQQSALDRTKALLVALERLQAAGLGAVADLDGRELFALDGCASTRGWLRTQPCGDHGQLAAARRLRARPRVRAALAAGTVSTGQAAQLCTALSSVDALEVPDPTGMRPPVGEDQVLGLLVHGLAPMLDDWTGTRLDPELVTETHLDRREHAAAVLTDAANGTGLSTADRLEPALVLLATALPASALPGALGTLVDALQPEQRDADADRQHVQASWQLTHRPDGGWDLHAVLDDVTGARLDAEIRARLRAGRKQAARDAAAAAEAAAHAAAS